MTSEPGFPHTFRVLAASLQKHVQVLDFPVCGPRHCANSKLMSDHFSDDGTTLVRMPKVFPPPPPPSAQHEQAHTLQSASAAAPPPPPPPLSPFHRRR